MGVLEEPREWFDLFVLGTFEFSNTPLILCFKLSNYLVPVPFLELVLVS